MINPDILFAVIIGLVVLQRLAELFIAKRNERWLCSQGAIEYGKSHYKYIVALHTLWFVSMIAEYVYRNSYTFDWLGIVLLSFFLVLQVLRIWVLSSLGKYWNTKILVVPNVDLVSKGLYKFIRHPNYVIVALEIVVLPLAFHLFVTAIGFTIFNVAMMSVRIREENMALGYNKN